MIATSPRGICKMMPPDNFRFACGVERKKSMYILGFFFDGLIFIYEEVDLASLRRWEQEEKC